MIGPVDATDTPTGSPRLEDDASSKGKGSFDRRRGVLALVRSATGMLFSAFGKRKTASELPVDAYARPVDGTESPSGTKTRTQR
jgi:hypothetical protein